MRKTLFTLILAVVSGACAWVHAQTIVLSESFENGLPAGWTQEHVIGSTSWTTETAGTLLYPDSTVAGYSRAVLRNETGETQGFKTRLITPVMNLDTVFQPILRYFHAQVKWTADFDTLRVLYRNTKDGEWQLLQEFTQPIQTWRKEELDLPQVSTTYQLCFEGTDNLGRGIVLDSVLVRSKPECTIPHEFSTVGMLEGNATLLWQASYDAEKFQVVLIKSKEVLDIDTMSEATKANLVVLDSMMYNDNSNQFTFKALQPATNYVAYVRSICEVENSDWGVYPFFMKAIKNVPYAETFDMALTSGEVGRLPGWNYGNDLGKNTPFINTHQNAEDAEPFVVSGTALCFTAGEDVGDGYDIFANKYVYAATPELNVKSLQNLRVRFWGSLGTHGGMNTNARSIIIGVMEDPEDITTFVAVDTMTLWKYATYEEHITSFADYTGEGKSIAFVSNFDKPNQFYIDNMTIEEAPAVAKVSGVNAIPAITEATIEWNAVKNATEYSVLIDTINTAKPDTLQTGKNLIKATATTNSYKATNLTAGKKYYVYVKANGSNEWSNALEFTTSCKMSLPMTFGFENAEKTYDVAKYSYSTYKDLPVRSTSSKSTVIDKNSKYGLYYDLKEGRDAWMVFPMVDTLIQDVEIEFYMATKSGYTNTALEIGVMTDPDDLNTFVAIASAKNGTTTFKRFYANFMEYTGDGKYIALRWVINEAGGATTWPSSMTYIDDVKIQPLSTCRTPEIKIEWATDETARLSWKAIGMDNFQLIISTTGTYKEDELKKYVTAAKEDWPANLCYVFDNIQDSTAITLPKEQLKWGHSYYAYIRSVCSDTVQSLWSGPTTITLPVPEAVALPYAEGFDDFGASKTVQIPGWVKANSTVENPYVSSTKKEGKAGWYFNKTAKGVTTPLYAPVVDIDDLSKLMISFYGKAGSKASSSVPDLMYIGVGHEPSTSDKITWLDTISIPTTSWELYRVLLPNWEPSMGNRVVFYNDYPGLKNTLYVDEVTFENFVDATPFDLELLSVGETEATFQWTAEATQGWNVLVTKESILPNDTIDPSKVVYQDVTTNNPYSLADLTAQTDYYVYLKPVAGNALWSEELHIVTQCLKLTPSNQFKMTFEGVLPDGSVTQASKSSFPNCWVRNGGSTSYMPFIYQKSSGTELTPTSNMHAGNASAQLSTTADYYPAWFATPQLAAKNMENVTIKFWAKADKVEHQMELGVMVDPDDMTTYTKLVDIKPGSTSWKKYSYLLKDRGYKPEMGNYFVFAMTQEKTSTFYIDDIEITESSCRSARPTLSQLTHNSVRLAYSSEPTTMRVVLAKDTVLDAELLNAGAQSVENLKAEGWVVMDTLLADKMSVQLQDLVSNTNYSAALLTLCDEDVSSWETTAWQTMCEPYSLAEVELIDFEEYNSTTSSSVTYYPIPCWVTGNKAIIPTGGNIPYVLEGKVAPEGSKSLKFYTTEHQNGAYAIMPALDVDDITKYELTFLGRAMDASTATAPSTIKEISDYAGAIIVGILTDPADLSTFEAVDTIVLPDNAVHLCKVRFNMYQGDVNEDYGKYVAFMSEFDKENYFYVDNISIAPIEKCGAPLDLTLTNLSYKEASISWNGTTDAYRVVLAAEELTEEQWEGYTNYLQEDTVTDIRYTFQDLAANTSYYVYVKSLCDAGEGKWNLVGVSFTTDCAPFLELPFKENFDNYASSSTKNPPSCWTTFHNGLMSPDATYPSIYKPTGTTSNCLYWYLASTYKAENKRPTLASLPIEDVSRVMVSFQLKTPNSSYAPKLAIGYATDVSSIAKLMETVQYVDTITPTKDWVEYSVLMAEAKSIKAHLVFTQIYGTRSNQELHMDDLKIELTPSCFAPRGANVLDVTYDEATVQITPFSAKDNAWDVMMISKDLKDTVITTVDTTTAVVKGLKHSTYYTVYVRTNCGEGDVSAWSDNTAELLTKFKIGEGWTYTFEHSEGVVRTPISKSDYYMAHPSLYIGGNMGVSDAADAEYTPYQAVQDAKAKFARSGEAALQFNTSDEFYQSWVALPMMTGDKALQMRLDMRAAEVNGGDTILDIQNYNPITRLQIGVINEDYNLDSYQVLAEYMPSNLMLGEKVTEAKNLLFDQIVVPLPADLTGKRIVLMNPSRTKASSLYVDNLSLEKQQGWQTPVITTSTITPTTLTVDWTAPGSSKWNVYLTQGTEYFPLANIPAEAIVAKQEGLTTTTATFDDLQPNTTYFVYVQIAGVEDIAATSVRRLFKTPVAAKIATDSILTFEGVVNEDLYSLYPLSTTVREDLLAMSNNWYVGNMSTVEHPQTPWARLNGYNADLTADANVGVAYAGERALQLWSTTTNDQLGAYAVMPEVDGDYDTLQVNFYARPYAAVSNKVAIAGADYQNKPLVVGMMTDPNNPATFVAIDSLYYDNVRLTTNSDVSELDNNGFERFSFRLAGVNGKYIAFSAPSAGHWYIDNIYFSEYTCMRPLEFEVKDVTKNSVVLTWRGTDNDYIVQVSTSEDFAESTICFVDTVPANEVLTIGNLKSVTKHYVRICELCSPGNTSPWATNSFTTECFELSPGFTCGFEKEDGRVHQGGTTATAYDIAQCWMSGTTYDAPKDIYKYLPAVAITTDWSGYAHNTLETVSYTSAGKRELNSTGSLKMYAQAFNKDGVHDQYTRDQWAVMPRMDLESMDPDTMQLEFYALPGYYESRNQRDYIKESYTGNDYLPSIVLGVMTDPNDITTFTAVDTCTYDLAMLTSGTVATPANEFMFQRFIVPLAGIKGKGEYLAFKTYAVDYVLASPDVPNIKTEMYIDDVVLAPYNECTLPTQLTALEVGATTATLTWNGIEGASWIVNLSADPTFVDPAKAILTDEVATEMSIAVTGLDTTTTYYWTVQQVCGAQSQSYVSQCATFKTAYVPMFNEEFIDNTLPLDWMRDTTRACYVFAGAPLLNVTGATSMWDLEKTNYGIAGQHMSAPLNSGGDADAEAVLKKSWLVTPLVYLDAEKEAWFTFSVALTRNGSDYDADQDGWDDQFMVVVSEDGGKTWKRENATIWNNERSNDPTDSLYVYGKGDYVLNDLPKVSDAETPMTISLAQYKGKSVKIGFYSESSVINAYNEIHVGKAHLNYVERISEYGESCQFADIVSADGSFYINGDSVEAGTYEFYTFDLASLNDKRENPNDGLVDTLYTFTAQFNAAAEVVIEKTICEGEMAGSEWKFEDRSTSGTYRRKGTSVSGCDSVTTLILTVLPIIRTEEQVTICAGTSYEFAGKQYAETGVYVDTLSSVVTGCDSIATLILTVTPPITYEYEEHICTGSSYYFTENYPALTMAGKYIETLKTVDGCDSIVTLNLVVSDVIEIEVFDTICAGDSYEFAGEQYTEAGAYPITYESTMGCDSTVTLHLYVNEPVALQLYDTICAGSTYTYNGEEYTEAGVYEFTYTSAVGCDSVVTLNLVLDYADTIVVDTTIYDLDLPYFYPNTSVTYPKGTEPGLYTDTVMVAGDSTDCGYLLIHNLTIIPGTGLDNVLVGSLLIKPSLIEQGESVTISGFGGNKAVVYVYDMVGRCVEQQAMTGNSIELNTFTTSGVYTVRVVDANGEQHVGRVMVK